ncbi:hypothetical protein WJX73_010846 [Symbiochloris irregularis]|uniref:Uncharacterized protein n=1 Tax=Symbiochloris irregularis TaxID=706552 RepID=A0AAW1P204_9CHLO
MTARRLGIPTVAVFSEADIHAAHVSAADSAYCIGPAAARDSYLNQANIFRVAEQTGATAIHPGYGFLSENAQFARACLDRQIAFVGPPAAAITSMGDKSEAKALMSSAGVPVVPGYHEENQDLSWLEQQAAGIGFPLLIKAVSGGGGKGMKLAADRSSFLDALASAKREAAAAFGDDRVLLERYISKPRHIEVQVFADSHGNCVHLHERDCSMQRRHQKVIEEAPAPNISEEFRRGIGEAAVAAAKAVGYVNAGTVEFIVDTETGEYFFMEMNTRLQVEHPVTEMITGLDLVEWQLHIASGGTLPLTQTEIPRVGHAFEARLYAESPERGFLPSPGVIRRWRVPPEATAFNNFSDMRVDSGVREGDEVGAFYDPLIAKVIAGGHDRTTALNNLVACLSKLQVGGLSTNAGFLQRLAMHPAFIAADLDTGFIPKHLEALTVPEQPTAESLALAALAFHHFGIQQQARLQEGQSARKGPWQADSFRINHAHSQQSDFTAPLSSTSTSVTLTFERDGSVHIAGSAQSSSSNDISIDIRSHRTSLHDDTLLTQLGDHLVQAEVLYHQHADQQVVTVWSNGQCWEFHKPLVREWASTGVSSEASGTITAPMPGKITAVLVGKGQSVEEGAPLVVMEAMKMEHTIRAPCSGTVDTLSAVPNQQVSDGHVLVVIAPHAEGAKALDEQVSVQPVLQM